MGRRYTNTLIGLFLCITIALGACSSEQPSPDVAVDRQATPNTGAADTRAIISFGAALADRPFFEPIIERFNRDNPDIRVVFINLDEALQQNPQKDTVLTAVTSADTALAYVSAADITRNYLLDLQPLIDADPAFEIGDYYPRAFEPLTTTGVYALPTLASAPLLGVNQTRLDTAGIDTTWQPRSWDELLEVAETVVARERSSDIYGLITGNLGFSVFLAEIARQQVDLFQTAAGEVDLHDRAIVEALDRTYARATGRVVWNPKVWMADRRPEPVAIPQIVTQLVNDGNAVFWDANYYAPDPEQSEVAFEARYIPVPPLTAPTYLPGQLGYVISSGTSNPTAAWRWLSFASTFAPPVAQRLASSEVLARRSLNEQAGVWAKKNGALRAALEPVLAQPSGTRPAVNEQLWLALHDAWDQRSSGQQTADAVLRAAQERLQQTVQDPAYAASRKPVRVTVAEPIIPSEDQQRIRFATRLDRARLSPVVTQFMEQHPDIHIDVSPLDIWTGTEAEAQFIRTAANADCFTWPSGPPQQGLSSIADLRPLIDAEPAFDLNDYPPGLLRRFQDGARLTGLPLDVRLRVLVYNEQVFQSLGLTPPAAAMSTDDFAALAQQVTQGSGSQKRYGYAMTYAGLQDIPFFLDLFGASISRAGVTGVEPDFTNPAVVRALSYYVTLLRQASPHTSLPGYNNGVMYDYISGGQSAMWLTYNLRGLASPGDEGGASSPVTPRAVAPPQGSGGAGSNNIRVTGMYIAAQSPNAGACWTWLKFLGGALAALDSDTFPARRSLATSPDFLAQAVPQAGAVYKAYQPILEAPAGSTAPNLFDEPRFDPYWLYQAIDRAVQGGDLTTELQAAQQLTALYLLCVQQDGEAQQCARKTDTSYSGIGPTGGSY